MIENLLREKIDSERILINEPMKNHTTFKIGGNADIFVSVKSTDELKYIIEKCTESGTEYFVMGNGSNLLVRDNGFRGVIIQICNDFCKYEIDGNNIKSQSGIRLSQLANAAMKNSLKGMEFAGGIPGTLGGAIAMNAGAYGGEMKDIVTEITVLKNNKITALKNEECEFGYRSSKILKEKMIVLEVCIKLERGNQEEIKNKMAELNKARSDKQPLNLPSAGSTFKRPEGFFAGKLIMEAGLRGFSVGDASVSEKHCGFIVNNGNATADDVITLIEEVKKRVKEQSGVELEPEIRVIGE